ncbi:pheromone A receptor-domain-containing protein [Armillaria novae-zelandiae]|uniref:Pheromone A receptor-domain-containing protein n=1 Tax=Armillaria novae-zelandiae TaxID=153914 RepID=A0AA39NXK0_9AGAR|nr:pheromone A receptor-domain-containing protein [Armillaria novae-zelandiae]
MFVGLPITSFFFVAILAVLAFCRPVKSNAALTALVLWSVFCNIIHGVDAILWADNTNIHAPVWCDISSRTLLASHIAFAGASLRVALDLEDISSSRVISDDKYTKRVRRIFNTLLCFLVPLLYVILHLFFQYHRFDIVQNFGCFVSVRPSASSFVVMIIPALILCAISFVASGFTVHRICHSTPSEFTEHLSSRSSLTFSSFWCRLATTTLVTLATLITSIVTIAAQASYAIPQNDTQDTYHRVFPITVVKDSRSAQAAWWGVFTVSLVVFSSSLIEIGKEKICWKWLTDKASRLSSRGSSQDILLPSYRSATSTPATISRNSLSHHQPKPQNVDFVSGWDDMLSSKRSKKSKSPPPPPSPLQSDKPSGEDEAFTADTLKYLQSSAARSLGILTSEDRSRAPSSYVFPKLVVPDRADEAVSELYRRRPSVPDDATSITSSFNDIPWPMPPPEIPVSPSRYSVIDATEYPITWSLLEQRKTAPLRIPSRKKYRAEQSAQGPNTNTIIQMISVPAK